MKAQGHSGLPQFFPMYPRTVTPIVPPHPAPSRVLEP